MKVKKHHKFKRYLLIFIIIFIIGFFLIPKCLYFLTTTQTERDLKKLKYNDKAVSIIINEKLDKYLIHNSIYSKTLEVALTNGEYESTLLDGYISLPYKDYDSYITQINKLSDIGYKVDEIKIVFNNLDEEKVNIIINENKYIKELTEYIQNKYFKIENIDRYISYESKNDNYNCDEVIKQVNMFLDYPYYKHDIDVNDPNNLLVIVNKYYKLSSTFIPESLVKIDAKYSYGNNTYLVVPIVKQAFDKMVKDMINLNLNIEVKSAYRSYQTQTQLYNDYVKAYGKEAADTFSARPGYSEHQTGLAIDVKTSDGDYSTFENTNEYEWMKKNAYKYGFILRYPADKTNITGYKFEAWHFRYVGNDIAKYIYEHNITFDEYYSMFIAK